jgi:UDP-N-acetylglucosamine--dolichyl-phosphate N-acetylglucosaminephosphotransferase
MPAASSASSAPSSARALLRWESLVGGLLLLPSVALWSRITDAAVRWSVARAALASAGAFALTLAAVPRAAAYFLRRGLSGADRGKGGRGPPLPSALGLIPACVFLCAVICAQLAPAAPAAAAAGAAADARAPAAAGAHAWQQQFSSALLAVAFMALLGFADDVLDLPWRYKLALPRCAAQRMRAAGGEWRWRGRERRRRGCGGRRPRARADRSPPARLPAAWPRCRCSPRTLA